MKTAFAILKRDLLALAKNPIALLVVGALLVLPGLYAWYCIIANWDPYANTGNMPIAVVNRDKGASSSLTGEIDIGRQVTDKLAGNDSIDWRFYDSEEEALEDTRQAVVYATLVLPEDLSQDVLGIFEGASKRPAIYYYPNEKYNAVATKVTDSAAQTLIRQVNQGFSSTVNEKILSATQGIADKVEERADETNKSAIAEVRGVQADLDKVVASLDDAASSIAGWRNAADGASTALSGVSGQLPAIRSLLERGSSQLDELRSKTSDFEGGLSSAVLKSASTVSSLSAKASTTISRASADLKAVETELEALIAAIGDDPELKESAESLELAVALVKAAVDSIDSRVSELNERVQEAAGNVSSATDAISGTVMPQLNSGAYDLALSFRGLAGAISLFEPQITQMQDVLAQTDGALDSATGAIDDAKALLSTIGMNLRGTVGDIGAIGSALEIERLSDLLEVDPANVGTFISSPVSIVTEEIFPVSNYGTAVAPFYTNLALWIGCFILVSLMKVEVAGFEGATSRQRYFGRWLLFVILSLLQSQVICGVDILLGIDCANPALFMLAGAACSFAYMNLIYAFVITFRNIGKTLCILLLIMQVPGSSGMYPIQMMPGFFQFIHPALPFTYGIDAMREALCGMYGSLYAGDLLVLAAVIPVSLFIGLAVRPNIMNLTQMFDGEMRKVGFFASEEHGRANDEDFLRNILRAFGAHDSFRDDVEERAWRFKRRYPRLRRAGTIATFAIPFVFVFIMLPFNAMLDVSIGVKITSLIIILVLLFAVLFGLIALEYANRMVIEETRLIGADILDDDLLAELAQAKELSGAVDEGGAAPAQDDTTTASFVSAGVERGKHAAPAAPRAKRGPAADIFATDLRLGFQSVIGVVVIMLLVITPSLYAWFNIAGSWDPYSATGNLKVAVANEDEGYKGELVPVTMNVGDTVVAQLRGNTSFNWVFVSKDEAIAGVESSEYYAAIEIPADFSLNMMTYLTDDTDYPDVVYYSNEKENPIAPIITQKGADSIQENIRVSFTERVDQVALTVAYDLLDYVTNPRMSSYVTKMSAHLDDAIADAKSAAKELGSLSGLVKTVSSIVDATGAAADGLGAADASARVAVADAKAGASSASAAFQEAVSVVEGLLGGNSFDVGKVKDIVDGALDLLGGAAGAVPSVIDTSIADVQAWKTAHAGDADVVAKCDRLLDALEAAKKRAESVPGDVATAKADTDGLIADAQTEAGEVTSYFNDTVKPAVGDLRTTVDGLSASASEVVAGVESAVAGIGDSTGGLSNQLSTLSGGLRQAGDKLEGAAGGIEATEQRLAEALSSGDLKQIEAVILGSDPEVLSASLAAPIEQQREAMYPVANYGSAMAPFYTVLSLWVGALVMISTMRVHVTEERLEELRARYPRLRPRHEFLGRYGIFGFIGLLQSALVLLGDLMFLHVQSVSPVMFFVCGLFIGQVFCLVVYTLTELFGDVGKALCVILLIMQVAASGGTFPVQMLDPLLSNIVPFLPFYHAMSMLQKCVAGIDWLPLAANACALLAIAGIALVAAIPLRRPFRKVNDFFEEQLERTGYM